MDISEQNERNIVEGSELRERGILLFENGRAKDAIQEFLGYLALNPDDSEAHTILSLCFSQTEDPAKAAAEGGMSEAMRFALSGIRLDPENSQAHYARAVASSVCGDTNTAEAAMLEAIRLDPEDAVYDSFLARIYFGADRYTDALEWADRALTFNPEYPECLGTRAMALMKLDRIDDAIDSAKLALATDPENADCHAVMGWIALKSGRPRVAANNFRNAIRLAPNFSWAIDGYNQAARANPPLFQFVGALAALLLKLPGWCFGFVIVGGWIAAHAVPRLTIMHPQMTLQVGIGLTIYFALNLAVRVALSSPAFAAPLTLPGPDSQRGFWTSNKPSQLEVCYFLSLGCLPISLRWWPGLIISVLADFLLIWAMLTNASDVEKKNKASPLFGVCVLTFIIFWLRGQ